jgi:histidine ammonia-lyase
MQGRTPTAPPLRAVFDKAAAALDPRTEDRPLDADLTTAAALLTDL